MGERTFKITEEEINKVFQFVISKPINEAIEVYGILLEVGKRADIELIDPKAKEEVEVESKDKE